MQLSTDPKESEIRMWTCQHLSLAEKSLLLNWIVRSGYKLLRFKPIPILWALTWKMTTIVLLHKVCQTVAPVQWSSTEALKIKDLAPGPQWSVVSASRDAQQPHSNGEGARLIETLLKQTQGFPHTTLPGPRPTGYFHFHGRKSSVGMWAQTLESTEPT